MDEEKIFEAFGLSPESGNGKEPDGGAVEDSAAQGDIQKEGVGREVTENAEAAQKEEPDTGTGEKPAEETGEGGADQQAAQTEAQRRENAAQRRRQEQQAAIDQAVSAALEKEREKVKNEWADFFARAKLKNSFTDKPIATREEFDEWSRAYDAARLSSELKEGKLTPETLDKAIAGNPAVKRAEEIVRRDEEVRRQQEEAKRQQEETAAKARIDAELQEIHKMDPSINGLADLVKMPNAGKFYEYVKRGNSFLDAWYLANREQLAQQTAEAAKQQAMNAARSKNHLTATGGSRGAGAASVPADEMRIFKLLNPGASEADIQAYYNKQKKG